MHGLTWFSQRLNALLVEEDAVLQVQCGETVIAEVTGVYDRRDAEHKLLTLFGADFANAIDLVVA